MPRKTKSRRRNFEVLGGEFEQATREVETLATKIGYPLHDGNTYAHLAGCFLTGMTSPARWGNIAI